MTHSLKGQTCATELNTPLFPGPPEPQVGFGINVKIFRTPSDNDIISWQENTRGDIFLYHRFGAFRFGRLHRWQEHAQRTAVSTFAWTTEIPGPQRYTPTASYQIRYGDIPEPERMYLQLPTIDSVVLAFWESYNAPPGPVGWLIWLV